MRRRSVGLAMSAVATAVVMGGLVAAPASAAGNVRTWTGLGADGNWTNAANWDAVPVAGDDLVFPDIPGTARHVATNDFAVGTAFGSVVIEEPGYTLTGNQLGTTGGLKASYATSSSTIQAPVSAGGAVACGGAGRRHAHRVGATLRGRGFH